MFTSQWEGRLIYSLSTMTTELESAYPWSVSLGLCSHNVSNSWLFCLLLRHTKDFPSAWSKIFFFSDNEFPVNCSSEMSVADWPILCLHFENYPQSIARCKQSLYQLTMLIHSVQFRKVDSSAKTFLNQETIMALWVHRTRGQDMLDLEVTLTSLVNNRWEISLGE